MSSDNKISEKLNIIIITYRLEDNPAFRPAEENLLKMIFKLVGIKFETKIFLSEKTTLFFGKLPCLYINSFLIQNIKLLTFIKEIFDFQNENLLKMDLIEYLIGDELKNSIELNYTLERNHKLENSKDLLTRIMHFFSRNYYYEGVSCKYLNIQNEINLRDMITNRLIKSYVKLHSLLKDNLYHHKEDKFNFIEAYVYSYLKEEKTLFTVIKRPTLEKIKVEEKQVLEALYNFYDSFKKSKKRIKLTTLKSNPEIIKIASNYTMIYNKSDKNKEKKELSLYEKNSVFKYNIFAIGIFLGVGLIFYMLSNRKEKEIKPKIKN